MRTSSERTEEIRGPALQLLFKMVLKYDKLPSLLWLRGVTCEETESRDSGGFANVYYGTYDSEPVAVKRLHVYAAASDLQKVQLREVG